MPKKVNSTEHSPEYFYRWMLAIRRLELKLKELYIDRKINGALHLSIGQEAVPVGNAGGFRGKPPGLL